MCKENNPVYLLSVITVCYNAAKTIGRTINSVCSQKTDQIEYIIIDGGSTDQTLQVIDSFERMIDIVVSEPDDGIYDAMNKGVSLARGEYISFINADDYYEENVLLGVLNKLNAKKFDIVFGKTRIINDEEKSCIASNQGFNEGIWERMPCGHPALFARKDLFDRIGGFNCNYTIAADYDWLLRVYASGVTTNEIDEVISVFSEGGISTKERYRCAYETFLASRSLRDTVLDPQRNDNAIDDRYRANMKLQATIDLFEKAPDRVAAYIDHIFMGENSLVVWGTGVWGDRIAKMSQLIKTEISFFVDADENKINKTIRGNQIKTLSELDSYTGGLIIAVMKDEKQILRRIKKCNKEMLVLPLSRMINDLGNYYIENNSYNGRIVKINN